MSNIVKFSAKVLVATALLNSVAVAEGTFIGFEGALLQSTLNPNVNGFELLGDDPKDTSFDLGFKVGQDFGDYRIWASYTYRTAASESYSVTAAAGSATYDVEWKSHNFSIGGAYTPAITQSFRALLGAYVGIARTTIDEAGTGSIPSLGFNWSGNDSTSGTGVLVGAKVGGIYAINDNHEVEFGVKADYADTGVDWLDSTTNYGIYVGYNYKF
ncbi:MAG: hypothetical protein IKK93_04000 [Campylobacter sp.]|nr:hypothetical protein [Campylobacter sp.]